MSTQTENVKHSFLSRRKMFSFFACLVIATFLWFINALNRTYTRTIAIPVKYENLPVGKRIVNQLPPFIMADIKTSGAKLLMLLVKKSIGELSVDVSAINKRNKAVSTVSLIGNLSKLLNTEVDLIKVRPDSLHFLFGKTFTKKVAVKPQIQINYTIPQGIFKRIKVTPQYVTISSDSATIAKIDTLYTEKLVLNNFNRHVEQPVNIEISDDLEGLVALSQPKVMLQINLDEYAQKTIEVPVEVINAPANSSVKLFPSTIKITANMPYNLFDSLNTSTTKAFVDMKKVGSIGEKLPITISTSVNDCKLTQISPKKVEYIIRKQ